MTYPSPDAEATLIPATRAEVLLPHLVSVELDVSDLPNDLSRLNLDVGESEL